jgi:DNA-directed RNA polymerase specialized sigma24 family protein
VQVASIDFHSGLGGSNSKGTNVQRAEPKKRWILTPDAFDQLLNWLDKGKASGGERYLEMRRRLVAYFSRKNCLTPDELADETLNRVARRLTEEQITESDNPARYCYTIARFVFMEYLRESQRSNVPFEEVAQKPQAGRLLIDDALRQSEIKEKMMNCLERCTEKLEPVNREIIVRYYSGQERAKIENRRALAESLGISMNALTIRACRIRAKLEGCVRKCFDS